MRRKLRRTVTMALVTVLLTALLPVQATASSEGLRLDVQIINPNASQQGQPIGIELTVTKDGAPLPEGIHPVTISGYSGYSRNGLMLWYDAIDNQGTGTQNSNAVGWRDLSGHGNNGTLKSSQWTKNSLQLPGSTYSTLGMIQTPALPLTGDYSVELFYDTSRNTQPITANNLYLIRSDNNVSEELRIFNTTAYLTFGSPNATARAMKTANIFNGSTSMVVRGMNGGTGTKELYSGGLPTITPFVEKATLPASKLNIGAGMTINDIAYHSVRIYNRALTDDELRGNFYYDQLHFNNGVVDDDRKPSPTYDPGIGTFSDQPLSYTGSTTIENVFFDSNGKAILPLNLSNGGIYNLRIGVTVEGESVEGDLDDTGINGGLGSPQIDSTKVEKLQSGIYSQIDSNGTTDAANVNYQANTAPRLSVGLADTQKVSYQWYLNDLPSRLTSTPITGATSHQISPMNLPGGISYLHCAASKVVGGKTLTSYSPLMAVRIGYGGVMNIGINYATGISIPKQENMYVYDGSTMTDPGGTSKNVNVYYANTLPQSYQSITHNDLMLENFYKTRLKLSNYYNTVGVESGGLLPILKTGNKAGEHNMPYLEGKDANGEYVYPPGINTQAGGILIPNWPVISTPLPVITMSASAGMRLSLPAKLAPLAAPVVYPVAADKINLEFSAANPSVTINVTTPDGSSVYNGLLNNRTVTLYYDYRTPLIVTQQTSSGELLETPLDTMALRRTIMAAGDHWYYMVNGELRSEAGIIPGDFVHLFGAQALDSAGRVHTLGNDAPVGSPVVNGVTVDTLPLHSGELDGSRLDSFAGYTIITAPDGSITVRDGQLMVDDGQLFAIDHSLLLNPDGVLCDNRLGLNYSTVLGSDGRLHNLMEQLKLPQKTRIDDIAHISSGGSQPILLVRYSNGAAAGWNYLTGEALPIEYLPDDLSFLKFVEGYFGAKPLSMGKIDGYPEIRKLESELLVYPATDQDSLTKLLQSSVTDELVTGDHKPKNGNGTAISTTTQLVDGKADGDQVDWREQVTDAGSSISDNSNDIDGTTDDKADQSGTVDGTQSVTDSPTDTTATDNTQSGSSVNDNSDDIDAQQGTTDDKADQSDTVDGTQSVTDSPTDTTATDNTQSGSSVNDNSDDIDAQQGTTDDKADQSDTVDGTQSVTDSPTDTTATDNTQSGSSVKSSAAGKDDKINYVTYYSSDTGKYELYDRNELLTQPQDLLQSVNKRLDEQGLLTSLNASESSVDAQELLDGANGLLLVILTALAVLAMLGYLHSRRNTRN